MSLLKDYKDAVLHGAYEAKQYQTDDIQGFDADKAFKDAFKMN